MQNGVAVSILRGFRTVETARKGVQGQRPCHTTLLARCSVLYHNAAEEENGVFFFLLVGELPSGREESRLQALCGVGVFLAVGNKSSLSVVRRFAILFALYQNEGERSVSNMSELAKQITDEQTGISYTLVGDYYLPDLALPAEEEYEIGVYGLMRKNYLKKHHRIFYVNLLTSGELNKHLREIDIAAYDFMELVSKQMAKIEGVTEQLKAENQLLWVQKMNGIRNRIMEMIREDLIYN